MATGTEAKEGGSGENKEPPLKYKVAKLSQNYDKTAVFSMFLSFNLIFLCSSDIGLEGLSSLWRVQEEGQKDLE